MQLDKIKFGEKIDKPGIYDIPMSWYHSDSCIGPSISSTGLREIANDCPAEYWAWSPLNPNRLEEPEDATEAAHFRIGRAAHTFLLEPEKAAGLFVTRPGTWDSWRTNDAKTWRANAQREGMTVFDPKEWEQVRGVVAALKDHAIHRDGIFDGQIEASVVWLDKKSGIWLKSRPDAIPESSATMLADLKVMADVRTRSLSRARREYGYDMQLALGGIGLQEVLGRTIEDYTIVAVKATPAHGVRLAPLDPPVIQWARIRLRAALDTMAKCLRDGYWPSYEAEDGEHLMLNDLEETSYKKLQAQKLLPKDF